MSCRVWMGLLASGLSLFVGRESCPQSSRRSRLIRGCVGRRDAVCYTIDPTQCAKDLEAPRNWIYHYHFLTQLKRRPRRKARLFPGKWDLTELDGIRILSEFDDRYTAPDGGYASGAEYYDRSGARRVLDFIPYSMFMVPMIECHPKIRVIARRTTDGEQRRWNERLPSRSGRRFTSSPHHGFFNRHKTLHLLAGG